MVEADIQSVVDKYARALEGSSLIFDLYPKPRPQGRPQKRYRPLPAAVTLSVISTFEGFAEDLIASFVYGQGFGWAYIALHANLTTLSRSSKETRSHRDRNPARGQLDDSASEANEQDWLGPLGVGSHLE